MTPEEKLIKAVDDLRQLMEGAMGSASLSDALALSRRLSAEQWYGTANLIEGLPDILKVLEDLATPKPEPVLRWEGDTLWLGEQRIGWFHVTPSNECQVVCSLIGVLSAPTLTEARTAAEQAVRDWLKRAGCV